VNGTLPLQPYTVHLSDGSNDALVKIDAASPRQAGDLALALYDRNPEDRRVTLSRCTDPLPARVDFVLDQHGVDVTPPAVGYQLLCALPGKLHEHASYHRSLAGAKKQATGKDIHVWDERPEGVFTLKLSSGVIFIICGHALLD